MTNTKQVAQAELSGSLFSATGQDAGAFPEVVLIATHAQVPKQFADVWNLTIPILTDRNELSLRCQM